MPFPLLSDPLSVRKATDSGRIRAPDGGFFKQGTCVQLTANVPNNQPAAHQRPARHGNDDGDRGRRSRVPGRPRRRLEGIVTPTPAGDCALVSDRPSAVSGLPAAKPTNYERRSRPRFLRAVSLGLRGRCGPWPNVSPRPRRRACRSVRLLDHWQPIWVSSIARSSIHMVKGPVRVSVW